MEDEAETCILTYDIALYKSSGWIRTLVSMAAYVFHSLIMGKVEIGNFYYLIGDNRILFLQQCLLNSSQHFKRHLPELLNLIGWPGQHKWVFFFKKVCFSRPISKLKVTYMFMVFATCLVV